MAAPVLLSIALPTYNRAGFLEQSLVEHRFCSAKYNVPIIISDNASDDDTLEVVEKSRRLNPLISYHRNEQTILPDENFEKALGYADTDYVWLLGDTYFIPKETFMAVMDAISEDEYDVVVVNMVDRVTDIPEQVYSDRNKLLADLGWHMTCLSTLIYSRKLLQHANFVRYRDTNFLQEGIIFEYLFDKPCKVKWMPQHSVLGLHVQGVKKTSWEQQTFEIWTKRWANFVFSLPATYSLDSKLKCIMDHGVKSGLFSFSSIKRLRKKRQFNIKIYRKYARYFPFTINYPLFIMRMLFFFPSWLLRLFGSKP